MLINKTILLFLTILFFTFFGFDNFVLANTGPKLLFSDMTDAPTTGWEGSATKGAAVSIYARNTGASRGLSYVTVGGVDLTNDLDYAEWGATTNPTVPLGMQRITFFLNSSMITEGAYPNTTISITTADGTSKTIPFHVRDLGSNHIYFIDNVNGSSSNNGLTVATAKRYPAWFRGNAVAGDILYIKGSGIKYTDHDNDTSDYTWSYGSIFTFSKTWHGTGSNFNNGIEGQSINVTAYPGDNVEMEAIGDNETGPSRFIKYVYRPLEYWTFSKMSINAHYPVGAQSNVAPPYGTYTQDFRLINLDITTPYYDNTRNNGHVASGQGMVLTGGNGSSDTFVLGCYFHDIAMDFRGQPPFDSDGYRSYFMYINGYGTYDRFELGWNEMGWVNSRGVQFYGHRGEDRISNLKIHDNWIHNTGRQNLVFGGEGGSEDYSFIQDAYIYNNILSQGGDGDVVLQMGGMYGNGKFGGNYYVYNNILDASNNMNYPAIHIGKELDSLEFRNNIIIVTPNYWDYYTYFPNTPEDFVADLTPVADHNLYFGAGSNKKPSWDNSILDNMNPLFITSPQTSYLDFQLQSSSLAINTGVNNTYADNDFLNISRPQGSAYDIGAYEYVSTGPDTTPPIISNPSPLGTLPQGTTETTLSVTTNENATCKYGTTPNTIYDSIVNIFTTTGGTTHTQTITGLTNGTTYNYYIRCKDTNNNENTTDININFSIANTPIIRADVNQDSNINTTDALLILRNILGLSMTSTNWQTSATTGDVNCDRSTNLSDVTLLLRYSLGMRMSGTLWCEGS